MRIGFDAKRAFFNFSGLGNYSRHTISCLGTRFPENEYHLYIPSKRIKIRNGEFKDHHFEYPDSVTGRKMPALWRSYWLGKRLEKDGIDLYHGLSNEIPFDLPRGNVKSIVTVHDLIFMRYPEWYNSFDRKIYIRKARHSCEHADRIIAISEQSRSDIVEFLGTPAEKIDVVYQGCNPMFYNRTGDKIRDELRGKYSLPSEYILYVGTIEPRKNLLKIVQAVHRESLNIPLVIIGRATPYIDQVRSYIKEHGVNHIHFLKDVPSQDLPVIYQLADIFIYPSAFEGFGIPILEALASGTPVITSSGGVFPEAGGESSVYVNPEDIEELGNAISKLLHNRELRKTMKEEGQKHAMNFKAEVIAENIMSVYSKVLR